MKRWSKRIFLGLVSFVLIAAVSAAAFQWIASYRDLASTPPPGRLVDVGGYRLHLWCIGSGEPAVLLDSGIGGTAFDWPFVQPEVGKFTRVCTYDRAGMGYSDPGPKPRTSAQIAAELAELLQRTDMESPVVLVGASFGGFNMRVFASNYPDRVAGLVLVDASHEDQGVRYAEAGVEDQTPGYARLLPIAASVGLLRLLGVTLGPPPERTDPSVREFVRATAYRTSRISTMADELMHTRDSGSEVKASRRNLTIPLIVLSAAKGRSGPWAEVHRALQLDQLSLSQQACRIVAQHSGHVIQQDQPEVVVDAIQSIVDTVRRPGSALSCSAEN
jgi:pimeloyl-ACP methyl ester carboxylesterase